MEQSIPNAPIKFFFSSLLTYDDTKSVHQNNELELDDEFKAKLKNTSTCFGYDGNGIYHLTSEDKKKTIYIIFGYSGKWDQFMFYYDNINVLRTKISDLTTNKGGWIGDQQVSQFVQQQGKFAEKIEKELSANISDRVWRAFFNYCWGNNKTTKAICISKDKYDFNKQQSNFWCNVYYDEK